MRVVITGICGFVGGSLARGLLERIDGVVLYGLDNLLRPGSETNRGSMRRLGVRFYHGDTRVASDLDQLPEADWVVDAAANPSVLAGIGGGIQSRLLLEHNLLGTMNTLEYCRRHNAGLILLSSSRVYSVEALAALPLRECGDAYELDETAPQPEHASADGITEGFSTAPPISLYGSSKLASETIAREYGLAFGFPVWVNRCGVMAGPGQFGTAEQGIFSYWIHAWAAHRPLRYTGFEGKGRQVRDALHPDDLAELICLQTKLASVSGDGLFHASGGRGNSMSLAQLSAWCSERFGGPLPAADPRPRPYDVPWLVLDSSRARSLLGWEPRRSLGSILDEIGEHARQHPDWLDRCEGT